MSAPIRLALLGLTAVSLVAAPPAPAAVTVWDDFRGPFSASGAGARWFHHPDVQPHPEVQGHRADDGIAQTVDRRLLVRASGTNPASGEPAFVRTMAQEDDNALGLSGQLDHHKWMTFMNHRASSGVPGFDARPGEELTFEAPVSARTFGTAGHPFAPAVTLDDDDPRLAGVVFGAVDFATALRFEFLITDDALYASYARTPERRTPEDRYAAFTHLVPLGARAPQDTHRLAVAYDRRAGTVRWVVDGRERFRVSRIGRRLDRRSLVLDHGGEERTVAPAQLDGGMGLVTLLDAAPAGGGPGLVRLSNLPFFYFDPTLGEPAPQLLVDNSSFDASRLFGQGAALAMGPPVVSTRGPVCGTGSGLLGLVEMLVCRVAGGLGGLLGGSA